LTGSDIENDALGEIRISSAFDLIKKLKSEKSMSGRQRGREKSSPRTLSFLLRCGGKMINPGGEKGVRSRKDEGSGRAACARGTGSAHPLGSDKTYKGGHRGGD